MADHVLSLTPGAKYYAGADLPFYVSRGMVDSYLTGHGFRDIQWFDRKDALPAGVNPQEDPLYSDDWTEWASATYAGSQPTSLDPPGDPAWVSILTPSSAKASKNATKPAALPAATIATTKTNTTQTKAVVGLASMAVTAVVTGLLVALLRK